MSESTHGMDKKAPMKSPLAKVERQFIDATVVKIPPWLGSYHLTLMTIPWTAGLIGFGALARDNLHWLWLSSLMLFLQWLTDCYDGTLGRLRDTGLVKWGFYMDHLLDFLFMSAIFIGYAFLVEPKTQFLLFLFMLVYGSLMVHSFLAFSATGEFKITYMGAGPTEIRLLFIIVNPLIIFFGIGWFVAVLPWALGIFFAAFCFVVYQTQTRIWKIDMDDKRKRTESG